MGQWVLIGFIGAITLVLSPALGSAQTLKERKAQLGEEEALASEVAYTNEVCGSNISASVDWQSFSNADLESDADPSGSCDAALSAIENMCTDERGQQAVKGQVSEVVCSKGTSRGVTLQQGTLMFEINGPHGDDFKFVRDYLSREFSGESNE